MRKTCNSTALQYALPVMHEGIITENMPFVTKRNHLHCSYWTQCWANFVHLFIYKFTYLRMYVYVWKYAISFICNAFLPCRGHLQVEVLTIVVSKVLVAVLDMCTSTPTYTCMHICRSMRSSSVLSATVTGAVSGEVEHWKFTCSLVRSQGVETLQQ